VQIYLNQFSVTESFEENYENGVAPFSHTKKYDLIVNPEVFTSGFQYNEIIDICKKNENALASIQELCKANNTAFCGSFLWHEDSKYFNRAFFIDSTGDIAAVYNKTYLIPAYKEDEYLTADDALAHFKFREFTMGLSICYDLRFPELFREYAKHETDAIIIMAQWPEKRLDHMITLARARAIENQCYVIIANAVGLTGHIENAGHSMIIHPKGNILIDLEKSTEGKDFAIQHSDVNQWRSEFPSLFQYSSPKTPTSKNLKGKHE